MGVQTSKCLSVGKQKLQFRAVASQTVMILVPVKADQDPEARDKDSQGKAERSEGVRMGILSKPTEHQG